MSSSLSLASLKDTYAKTKQKLLSKGENDTEDIPLLHTIYIHFSLFTKDIFLNYIFFYVSFMWLGDTEYFQEKEKALQLEQSFIKINKRAKKSQVILQGTI